jgi:hypothetical protein
MTTESLLSLILAFGAAATAWRSFTRALDLVVERIEMVRR